MESDQPPSTPSTNTRHPIHDPPTSQGSRSDERLLAPSAPPQGTSVYPEIFHGDSLPEIGTFSTSIDVHSYSSNMPNNIPHADIHYHPLRLDAPSQLIQSHSSHPLGIFPQYPSVGQPPTIYPLPAASSSLTNWQQSNSLPRGSLGAHPQPQEWADLALVNYLLRASTTPGPPPKAASLHRESVDESGPQVTSLPPM